MCMYVYIYIYIYIYINIHTCESQDAVRASGRPQPRHPERHLHRPGGGGPSGSQGIEGFSKVFIQNSFSYIYIYIHVYVCVYMYVCVYIYIYIYTYLCLIILSMLTFLVSLLFVIIEPSWRRRSIRIAGYVCVCIYIYA